MRSNTKIPEIAKEEFVETGAGIDLNLSKEDPASFSGGEVLMLTDRQVKFLKSRRRLARGNAPLFSLLLLVTLGAYAFFSFRVPLLGNPFHLIDALAKNQVGDEMIFCLAVIGSVLFHVGWFLIAVLAVLCIAFGQTEKKYLAVIESFENEGSVSAEFSADERFAVDGE